MFNRILSSISGGFSRLFAGESEAVLVNSPSELAVQIAHEQLRAARRQANLITLQADVEAKISQQVVEAIADRLTPLDSVGFNQRGQFVVVYPDLPVEQYGKLAKKLSSRCRAAGLCVEFQVVEHKESADATEGNLLVGIPS